MKLLYNGMEITCTPDEFEDLVTRGLIPGKNELIERNKEDDWIDLIRRLTPEKPKDAVPGRNWPPTVALYGCEMVQPITAYGCPSVATDDPYKPAYTSTVSISQEQFNKLNAIVNKDEQST